jgi:hypothetical protein
LNAFAVRIADVTLAVRNLDGECALHVQPTLAPFVVDVPAAADIELVVRFGDTRALAPASLAFDSGGVWRLFDEADGTRRFELRTPLVDNGAVAYKVARVDAAFRRGEIIVHEPYFGRNAPVTALEYPIDELLFMHHLACGTGVVMHGCGLVDAGRGFLFLGASGAGKSTMGSLWQRHREPLILSDDRIVLSFKDDRLWMSGTPWHGEASLAAAGGAPLERIFMIRHAAANSRVAINDATAVAVARLFACGFPPFHDRAALAFVMKFLARVANSVPVEDLGVVPTAAIIDTILA